jgi:hypothetical protein
VKGSYLLETPQAPPNIHVRSIVLRFSIRRGR